VAAFVKATGPTFWSTRSVSVSIAASCVRRIVRDAGGQVLLGPSEVQGGGWIIQGTDPQGAPFALVVGQHRQPIERRRGQRARIADLCVLGGTKASVVDACEWPSAFFCMFSS
jgi:hypothetical protein